MVSSTKTRRPSTGTSNQPGRKLLAFDQALGVQYVGGADEAGRGAAAGPMVCAAVAFDVQSLTGTRAAHFARLTDSKLLTAQTRQQLYPKILLYATAVRVVVVSPRHIDDGGVQKANISGLSRAVAGLGPQLDHVYIDGFSLPENPVDCACDQLVKGDRTSLAVAAASVIAKTTRDALMTQLDTWTGSRWGFSSHMGYPTQDHGELIDTHGISEHHRLSWSWQPILTALERISDDRH